MKIKKIIIVLILSTLTVFIGCSKDDNQVDLNKRAIKVTVTSSNDFQADIFNRLSVIVTGFDHNQKPIVWKINDQEGTAGQSAYSLSDSYFDGGKTGILACQDGFSDVAISITAFTASKSFTVSYKIEQNGKVIASKTQLIEPNDTPLTESFTY